MRAATRLRHTRAAAARKQPTVRGTTLHYVNNTATANVALPAGTQAGDLLVMFLANAYSPPLPAGWGNLDDSTNQTWWNGRTVSKVATADDLTAGSVTINFPGTYYGHVALLAVQDAGPVRHTKAARAGGSGAGAASVTLTTTVPPVAGDLALYFGSNRASASATTFDRGALLASRLADANASAGVAGEQLAAAGNFSAHVAHSVPGDGYYDALVLVAPPTPPAAPGAAYHDLVAAHLPLVYWRLGEASGTVATDASGNGRHGTYSGGPTLGQPSLIATDAADKAALFDGVDDQVNLASGAWMSTADFTVLLWAKWTAAVAAMIASHDDATYKHWDVQVNANGTVAGIVFNGIDAQTITSPGAYNDGQPHLIALVKTGRRTQLYVDGGLVVQSGDWPAVSNPPEAPLRVGGRSNGTLRFTGTVDEFAYLGSALSATHIGELYAAALG